MGKWPSGVDSVRRTGSAGGADVAAPPVRRKASDVAQALRGAPGCLAPHQCPPCCCTPSPSSGCAQTGKGLPADMAAGAAGGLRVRAAGRVPAGSAVVRRRSGRGCGWRWPRRQEPRLARAVPRSGAGGHGPEDGGAGAAGRAGGHRGGAGLRVRLLHAPVPGPGAAPAGGVAGGAPPAAATRRRRTRSADRVGAGALLSARGCTAGIAGDPELRAHLRVLKRHHPARGVGRGMYELLRLSARETLGEAPSKAEAGWLGAGALPVRGWLLSTPLGRSCARCRTSPRLTRRELYQGDGVGLCRRGGAGARADAPGAPGRLSATWSGACSRRAPGPGSSPPFPRAGCGTRAA